MSDSPSIPLNPGDDAPSGTMGTGEDTCPRCEGSGQLQGDDCPNCDGTGLVNVGIG
jgi:DnaJ-class molecular chaperone